MKDIWKRIKFEISLLSDLAKIILKLGFYILICISVFYITLPFLKYFFPKDLELESYGSISTVIIILLLFVSYYVYKFFLNLFKNHEK